MIIKEVYSIMDDYETEGLDLFNVGLIAALENFFAINHPEAEMIYDCSEWPNEQGGTCGLAWVEDSKPYLVMFDYRY